MTPEPSKLKLSGIVMTTETNKIFNLDVVARSIVIDETVTGVKYGKIIRGDLTLKKSKKSNSKRPDFSNQCSININRSVDGQIKKFNVKMFSNGHFVVPACSSKEDSKVIVKTICDSVAELKAVIEYDLFNNPSFPAIGSVEQRRLFRNNRRIGIFGKVIKYLETYYPEIIKSPLISTSEVDGYIADHIKLAFGLFYLFRCYYSEDFILEKLTHGNPADESYLDELLSKVNDTLKIKDTFPSYIGPEVTTYTDYISNINTSFSAGFYINQTRLCKLINTKYSLDEQGNTSMSALYSPNNYQAVNCSIISRVNCTEKKHVLCKHKAKTNCDCKCKCRMLTALIFKGKTGKDTRGSTIINGANDWSQLEDVYSRLCQIYRDNYDDIMLDIKEEVKISPVLYLPVDDGPTKVYMSKQHILKNQKNFAILAKHKMLEHFK